ncbi:hypothetical protein NKZ81_03455 [Streptococcus suis]|uniref:hypothetical protein n=1 Tax=Streptococcus suis TaxID=1307 RepID=UPI0020B7564A|nr:hypothetical protein [Streptococcus suis]UTH67531.1 hypothetical protein NKZ81_03455 [Streptococcus suis]
MSKDVLVVKIPEDLDKQFREEVRKQGKQFNLSLEEAIRLWLKEKKISINKKRKLVFFIYT